MNKWNSAYLCTPQKQVSHPDHPAILVSSYTACQVSLASQDPILWQSLQDSLLPKNRRAVSKGQFVRAFNRPQIAIRKLNSDIAIPLIMLYCKSRSTAFSARLCHLDRDPLCAKGAVSCIDNN